MPPDQSPPAPATARRSRGRRWAKRGLAALAVLLVYPVFVLGTVYTITLRSDLPGGRNGPRDAYRHSLASAIVAYTASPRLVDWVSATMDGGDGISHRMDTNNRIGARIGAAATGWTAMLAAVRTAVDGGDVVADGAEIDAATRIVWLPANQWHERLF